MQKKCIDGAAPSKCRVACMIKEKKFYGWNIGILEQGFLSMAERGLRNGQKGHEYRNNKAEA